MIKPTSSLALHTFLHLRPPLNISNSTLQRTRQINMKERSIQSMHNRNLPITFHIRLTLTQLFRQILISGSILRMCLNPIHIRGLRRTLHITRALALKLLLLAVFSGRGRGSGGGATDFSDGENCFPALEAFARHGWVAKAGGGEGSL